MLALENALGSVDFSFYPPEAAEKRLVAWKRRSHRPAHLRPSSSWKQQPPMRSIDL